MNLAIQLKKQFHDLIDSIPEDKLPKLFELFLNLIEEEKEELSNTEIEEIRQAKNDLKNGETYSFEEVFKDMLEK